MTTSLLSRLSDNHVSCVEDDYHWTKNTTEMLLDELMMLLNSRVRFPDIEDMPLINSSIINYGINESFSNIIEIDSRRTILETRLKNAIARFEPRLMQVTLLYVTDTPQIMRFRIQAYYLQTPIVMELAWNDCIGKFYFNE